MALTPSLERRHDENTLQTLCNGPCGHPAARRNRHRPARVGCPARRPRPRILRPLPRRDARIPLHLPRIRRAAVRGRRRRPPLVPDQRHGPGMVERPRHRPVQRPLRRLVARARSRRGSRLALLRRAVQRLRGGRPPPAPLARLRPRRHARSRILPRVRPGVRGMAIGVPGIRSRLFILARHVHATRHVPRTIHQLHRPRSGRVRGDWNGRARAQLRHADAVDRRDGVRVGGDGRQSTVDGRAEFAALVE